MTKRRQLLYKPGKVTPPAIALAYKPEKDILVQIFKEIKAMRKRPGKIEENSNDKKSRFATKRFEALSTLI